MKSLDITLKQVDDTNYESNNIPYWPVCEVWQKSMCQLLGIRFFRVHTKSILIIASIGKVSEKRDLACIYKKA